MARLAVKLLLLNDANRLLLIHARDAHSGIECWYPVGGGVEPGESLQEAAAREAYEETGLSTLPPGRPIWKRTHTYRFNGQVMDVAEEWLLHTIGHFDPTPARLTESEAGSILGFGWWSPEELAASTEIIYPPHLGVLVAGLLAEGVPHSPIDISQ